MDVPISNIKDYIVTLRKSNYADSYIIDALKRATWPEDIVMMAISEANKESTPIPEKANSSISDDLFTKPDIAKTAVDPNAGKSVKKEGGGFCFLSLIAFLVSWIPFIGLGCGMAAIEQIQKKKQSGIVLAILAVVINIAVLGLIAYTMYQILGMTNDPTALSGFSKFIVEKFGLLG